MLRDERHTVRLYETSNFFKINRLKDFLAKHGIYSLLRGTTFNAVFPPVFPPDLMLYRLYVRQTDEMEAVRLVQAWTTKLPDVTTQ